MVAAQKWQGLDESLPYVDFPTDGIARHDSGALTACWYFTGKDPHSMSPASIASVCTSMHRVLMSLREGWVVQFYQLHLDVVDYLPEGHFPDPTSWTVDEIRRRNYMTAGRHMASDYAISVTWRQPDSVHTKVARTLVVGSETQYTSDELYLQDFQNAIGLLEFNMSTAFKMMRMSAYDFAKIKARGSDILSFIATVMNGERQYIRMPVDGMEARHLLGYDFRGGLTPKIGDRHIAPIVIEGWPDEALPAMMQFLDYSDIPFVLSTRFIYLGKPRFDREVHLVQRDWENLEKSLGATAFPSSEAHENDFDDHAISKSRDAKSLKTDVRSGDVCGGYLSIVLLLFNEDEGQLDLMAKQMVRTIENQFKFKARRERVGATSAWFSALPGNTSANVVKPLMHSMHAAYLAPLFTIWHGPSTHPCKYFEPGSPPLMRVNTDNANLFNLCLYHNDVGSTAIVGPTGGGKSYLLNNIISQHLRYEHAHVTVFDIGKSSRVLAAGLRGQWWDVGASQLCPLYNIGNRKGRSAAYQWIASCCEIQGVKMDYRKRATIHRALELLAQGEHRSITALCSNIMDPELQRAMAYYAGGSPGGVLLDGETDLIGDPSIQVYELESLLENNPPDVYIPVLLFLLQRTAKKVDDGKHGLVILDEAALSMKIETILNRAAALLVTIRKKDASLILSLTSVSQLLRSPIAGEILESCKTKVFIPNAEATSSEQMPSYRAFQLTDFEIGKIASGVEKQDYLIKCPSGSRVFTLNSSKAERILLGSSGKDEIALAERLMEEFPDDWVPRLLEYHGETAAANLWRSYACH